MNGKKGLSLILLLVFSVSLLYGLTFITAKGPPSHFKGTFDNWYYNVTDPNNLNLIGAKIVSSSWSVSNIKNKAIFIAEFTELNIEEETPGTYDSFRIKMQTTDVTISDKWVNITGTAMWWKNNVQQDPVNLDIKIYTRLEFENGNGELVNLEEQLIMIWGEAYKITGSLIP